MGQWCEKQAPERRYKPLKRNKALRHIYGVNAKIDKLFKDIRKFQGTENDSDYIHIKATIEAAERTLRKHARDLQPKISHLHAEAWKKTKECNKLLRDTLKKNEDKLKKAIRAETDDHAKRKTVEPKLVQVEFEDTGERKTSYATEIRTPLREEPEDMRSKKVNKETRAYCSTEARINRGYRNTRPESAAEGTHKSVEKPNSSEKEKVALHPDLVDIHVPYEPHTFTGNMEISTTTSDSMLERKVGDSNLGSYSRRNYQPGLIDFEAQEATFLDHQQPLVKDINSKKIRDGNEEVQIFVHEHWSQSPKNEEKSITSYEHWSQPSQQKMSKHFILNTTNIVWENERKDRYIQQSEKAKDPSYGKSSDYRQTQSYKSSRPGSAKRERNLCAPETLNDSGQADFYSSGNKEEISPQWQISPVSYPAQKRNAASIQGEPLTMKEQTTQHQQLRLNNNMVRRRNNDQQILTDLKTQKAFHLNQQSTMNKSKNIRDGNTEVQTSVCVHGHWSQSPKHEEKPITSYERWTQASKQEMSNYCIPNTTIVFENERNIQKSEKAEDPSCGNSSDYRQTQSHKPPRPGCGTSASASETLSKPGYADYYSSNNKDKMSPEWQTSSVSYQAPERYATLIQEESLEKRTRPEQYIEALAFSAAGGMKGFAKDCTTDEKQIHAAQEDTQNVELKNRGPEWTEKGAPEANTVTREEPTNIRSCSVEEDKANIGTIEYERYDNKEYKNNESCHNREQQNIRLECTEERSNAFEVSRTLMNADLNQIAPGRAEREEMSYSTKFAADEKENNREQQHINVESTEERKISNALEVISSRINEALKPRTPEHAEKEERNNSTKTTADEKERYNNQGQNREQRNINPEGTEESKRSIAFEVISTINEARKHITPELAEQEERSCSTTTAADEKERNNNQVQKNTKSDGAAALIHKDQYLENEKDINKTRPDDIENRVPKTGGETDYDETLEIANPESTIERKRSNALEAISTPINEAPRHVTPEPAENEERSYSTKIPADEKEKNNDEGQHSEQQNISLGSIEERKISNALEGISALINEAQKHVTPEPAEKEESSYSTKTAVDEEERNNDQGQHRGPQNIYREENREERTRNNALEAICTSINEAVKHVITPELAVKEERSYSSVTAADEKEGKNDQGQNREQQNMNLESTEESERNTALEAISAPINEALKHVTPEHVEKEGRRYSSMTVVDEKKRKNDQGQNREQQNMNLESTEGRKRSGVLEAIVTPINEAVKHLEENQIHRQSQLKPQDKPLEILDVSEYFRDDFDLNSLDSLGYSDRIDRISAHAETFEDKVKNFEEEKFSLQYFVLDEKLMRLVEKLDKIKCDDDEVTTKKIVAIEYIKKLHTTLDQLAKDD